MITSQLQVGDDYKNSKKSIVIFITNYSFLKRNSYHSVGKMKFDETLPEEYVNMGYKEEDEIASKYIEFHYIEVPKYKKKETTKKLLKMGMKVEQIIEATGLTKEEIEKL